MTLRKRFLCLLVLALSAGGCSPGLPTKYDQAARQYMALVRSGDTAQATMRFAGGDTIANLPSILGDANRFLSRYQLDSAELTGWNVHIAVDGFADLTYELHGDSGWGLVALHLLNRGDSAVIAGFRWQETDQSLRAATAFTLRGKGFGHYLFLGFGIVAVAVSLVGAILAIRMRLRWWWVAFAIVGLGRVTLSWTAGDLSFNPFSIQLMSFSALRIGNTGPWAVALSFPLGAWWIIGKAVRRREARMLSGGTAA